MKEILERVFNLIRRTGDKVVIVNPEDEVAYVVMNLGDYEKIVEALEGKGLTENKAPDKIDKINQEIAIWREEAKKTEVGETPAVLPVEEKPEKEESQFYFEPVE